MLAIRDFIRKYAVMIYFVLTFIITWASIIAVIGPANLPMSAETFESVGAMVYVGMLIGPAASSLILIGLVDGRQGYRTLFSRLRTWRVGWRWYVVALLTTPILALVVLMILALFSPAFVPAVFMADDKGSLLLTGIITGLVVGFFEELGWTGFAIPRMRGRFNVLTTGLIVGILWGAWHFLPFWESDSFAGGLALSLLLARLFSWLPPFRVLLVWVYEHTRSLLVVMLMHASLVFTTLTLPSMELSGTTLLTWLLIWAAVLWVTALAVVITGRTVKTRRVELRPSH